MRKELLHIIKRLMSFNTIKKLSPLGGWGALFLIFACSSPSDEIVDDELFYLQASAMLSEETADAKPVTRAHWENDNRFVWDDTNNEMVIFVKESPSGAVVNWGEKPSCGARVKKLTEAEDGISLASITSNSGMLKTDILRLTIGQSPVYFLSPIGADNGSSVSGSVVTMALPDEFAQPEETHSLADFAKYTYIKAESTISEISNTTIWAEPAQFTGIPAVIRFIVTNDRYTSVKINSITLTPTTGEGFSKTVAWNPGSPNDLSYSSEKHDYVKATMATDILGPKDGEHYSKEYFVFIFPGTFTSATLTLTGVDNIGNDFSYSCGVSDKTFVGNRIYTWNLNVADNFINLSFNGYEDNIFQW